MHSTCPLDFEVLLLCVQEGNHTAASKAKNSDFATGRVHLKRIGYACRVGLSRRIRHGHPNQKADLLSEQAYLEACSQQHNLRYSVSLFLA